MIQLNKPQNDTTLNLIYELVQAMVPFDPLEQCHIDETLDWINSGARLFRITKPNIPDKHLVSYFIVFDEQAQKILLVDHKIAGLWLPPGGHVERDEHPTEAVKRECLEELHIQADFWAETPLFLTVTVAVGRTIPHWDVSLWYVLKGDHQTLYTFDQSEFNSIQWFDFSDIPYEKSDPHMKRFMQKLRTYL